MPRLIRALALLGLAFVPLAATAQQVDEPRPLVVMNLAAHPDDEDGLTLTYYRHARDAVAYSVLFTRGEGGQNEAGPDLYERLGALRTQETERAARILGTQVYYLNFYDFGVSKHAAETFREWSRPRHGFWDTDVPPASAEAGRDTVTARLVYLIRRLKPDVLFTNHDTLTVWPRAQHGNHQAVGISAWAAFEKAADPTYHPEQLAEAGVDLWQPSRLFVRSYQRPERYDVAVPVGDACNDKGVPCADLAAQAAAQHVSQGFDKFADRFRRDTTYFTLYRSAPGAPPLPPHAHDLAAGLAPNPHAAEASLAYLIDSGRLAPTRPPAFSGVVAVRGQRLVGPADTLVVPADAPLTYPAYRFQYTHHTSRQPFQYEAADGTVTLYPVEVAPPVVVDLAPAPVRLVRGENAIPVQVQTFDPAAEAVTLTLTVRPEDDGAAVYEEEQALSPSDTAAVFQFTLPDDVATGRYRVAVAASATPTTAPAEPYVEARPAAVLPDVRVADGLRVGFVRSYDRVTEDALRAMGADVVVLDSTALAEGAFDDLDTIVLDIRAYLVRPDLRAHNGRLLDWVRRGGHLVVNYHKTFEWNPGQTGGGFSAEVVDVPEGGWAPYPLVLSHDRVTFEDAPVEVLAPESPVFHAPYEIGPEDWAGWVQERGLYFPTEYDARYRELLSMHDPGEAPLRGSLLLADVGEGTYAYTALVFYRQLEALNPGAWRLFANLVSLPLTKGEVAQ